MISVNKTLFCLLFYESNCQPLVSYFCSFALLLYLGSHWHSSAWTLTFCLKCEPWCWKKLQQAAGQELRKSASVQGGFVKCWHIRVGCAQMDAMKMAFFQLEPVYKGFMGDFNVQTYCSFIQTFQGGKAVSPTLFLL